MNLMLDAYDAGLLNDYGGGDVGWWQDYLRAELARAHDHYVAQIEAFDAQPSGYVSATAWFLIDRLDDFERGSLGDGIEDACRDFDGHVSPAIERLRDALSQASEQSAAQTDGAMK